MSAKGHESAMRLGAHMSIAGGLHRAVERAVSVGATALQVFVKSARQWNPAPLSDEQVAAFRAATRAEDLQRHTLAHATYLINLASPESGLRNRSIRAFRGEIERCSLLGIPFVVLHPGSHVGSGEEAGLERVASSLDKALDGIDNVMVLLETTAGAGTNLGHRFEHLGQILSASKVGEKLGVCFDTCHVLAAGYEFRTPESYEAMWQEFDAAVGLSNLRAFHLNDSKHALGTRKDRHEHIGQGEVGLEGFRGIVNDERFHGLPMVLETPKGSELAEDRENMDTLLELMAR